MRETTPSLDRRSFLRLGLASAAVGLLAACDTSKPGVTVDLEAAPTHLDLAGTTLPTWAYGGEIPGREIRIRRGEVLRAQLANKLPAPTTVHWHGLALRNDMDGVPDVTQPVIAPGSSFDYEFTVPAAGTYWFHPHVGTQLDRGLYAPLIVEDPDEGSDYDTELVVVLDDWIDGTGTDPDKVLDGLHAKGMAPMDMSMSAMMPTPTRPLGMDGGDVAYPYYLANGRVSADPAVSDYRKGQRIRLRIINAGGDTAFRVAIPGTRMRVTHTDGYPVQPQDADAVILGMGERVDAVVTVGDSTVPLLAVPEDKDGLAHLVLRSGGKPLNGDIAAEAARLRSATVLNTATLIAAQDVQFDTRDPGSSHDLRLDGPGAKYTWTMNGKVYDPKDSLRITEGQRIRLRYINDSMMFHPMHLHGHTFAVRSPAGTYTARKDTVLVPPMQTVEVDFDATNPGQWLTHCHNVYHGEAGMMTLLSYVQ